MQPSDVRSMCCRLRLDLRELRKKTGGFFGSGESTGSVGVVTINMPRIATTLFSTTNPENVKKNITFIEEPIDWELVREVQEIIGEQKRVSWANS